MCLGRRGEVGGSEAGGKGLPSECLAERPASPPQDAAAAAGARHGGLPMEPRAGSLGRHTDACRRTSRGATGAAPIPGAANLKGLSSSCF